MPETPHGPDPDETPELVNEQTADVHDQPHGDDDPDVADQDIDDTGDDDPTEPEDQH